MKVKKIYDMNIKKYKAGVEVMNNTKKVAKDLVEQVKKLKPEVEEKKKNAESKSKIAEEEEKKANVVLESQKEVTEEVNAKQKEASEFLSKCNLELKEAEKFKSSAIAAVQKLDEAAIREVSGYKKENIVKMEGIPELLKAVLLIVTGKDKLDDLKNTLKNPKNLKEFDLNLIEDQFEKYKKICNTYKKW